MKKIPEIFRCTLIGTVILCLCFILCLSIQYIYKENSLIPAIFVMGVFLISVITDGYIYGAVAAVLGVFAIYELLPAFIFSVLCIVIVSLLTKKPSVEIEADFEAVKAGIVVEN